MSKHDTYINSVSNKYNRGTKSKISHFVWFTAHIFQSLPSTSEELTYIPIDKM